MAVEKAKRAVELRLIAVRALADGDEDGEGESTPMCKVCFCAIPPEAAYRLHSCGHVFDVSCLKDHVAAAADRATRGDALPVCCPFPGARVLLFA